MKTYSLFELMVEEDPSNRDKIALSIAETAARIYQFSTIDSLLDVLEKEGNSFAVLDKIKTIRDATLSTYFDDETEKIRREIISTESMYDSWVHRLRYIEEWIEYISMLFKKPDEEVKPTRVDELHELRVKAYGRFFEEMPIEIEQLKIKGNFRRLKRIETLYRLRKQEYDEKYVCSPIFR